MRLDVVVRGHLLDFVIGEHPASPEKARTAIPRPCSNHAPELGFLHVDGEEAESLIWPVRLNLDCGQLRGGKEAVGIPAFGQALGDEIFSQRVVSFVALDVGLDPFDGKVSP